jgi:zinc transporter ZupT
MESSSITPEAEVQEPQREIRWRIWALVPIILLIAAVSIFGATGSSLVDLVGNNPPPADEFDIRRVEFKPGEIRVTVTNPQRDELTIASVTVDDAIVNFVVEGDPEVGRLGTRTVIIPFFWVEDDPYVVGITSQSGIESAIEIPAAVESEGATGRSWLGYAIIGFLVGIVPVALGVAWLPSLRQLNLKWLSAFMALTAGMLLFLAFDALDEALELQAALPSAVGGVGLVVVGVAVSYLALAWIGSHFSTSGARERGTQISGLSLALLVSIGIGLHNLGEGLAIGSSFALGELVFGSFLIIGFMVHNITEGLGIAAPIAEGKARPSIGKLVGLVLIAGAPAIVGAWVGGFLASDLLGTLFFAIAVGAALQVVVEVGRYVSRKMPGGLSSGYAIGGFVAGLLIMYLTGLLIG